MAYSSSPLSHGQPWTQFLPQKHIWVSSGGVRIASCTSLSQANHSADHLSSWHISDHYHLFLLCEWSFTNLTHIHLPDNILSLMILFNIAALQCINFMFFTRDSMLPAEQPMPMELTRTTTLSDMFFSWSVLFSTDSSSSKLRNPSSICQFLSHCKIPALMRNCHSGIKRLHLLGSQDISLFKSFELTIILRGLNCVAKDVPRRNPHVTPDILPKLVSLIDLRNPVNVTFMSPFLCIFFLLA